MAKRMATRYDEFIETALLEPHRDPYSEAVRTVAEAGYVASVSAHPRPTAWLALDWRQEHRWLVVADYIVTSRRGPITAEGVRAVYYAGAACDPWWDTAPKTRLR